MIVTGIALGVVDVVDVDVVVVVGGGGGGFSVSWFRYNLRFLINFVILEFAHAQIVMSAKHEVKHQVS